MFRKGPDGKLLAAGKALGPDGQPLAPGSGTSVALGDLDGDGDQDLVVAQIEGQVRVYYNDGKGTFDKGHDVKVGNSVVKAVDGGPAVADWDGDGILDLLVGGEDGGVRLYLGSRKDRFELVTMDYLVQPLRDSIGFNPYELEGDGRVSPKATRSLNRVKPFVTDWDLDGKPDLVVGDFLYVLPPMPELPENQLDMLQRLTARGEQLDMQVGVLAQKIIRQEAEKHGAKDWDGLNAEARVALDSDLFRLMQLDPEFDKLVAANLENSNRFYTLRGMPDYGGFVWVYLRK